MGNSFLRIFFALIGGVPVLLVSIVLMMIWLDPGKVADGQWLKLGALMVIIEFVLLHSGAFMSAGPVVCKKAWQHVAWFFGFATVYGLFFLVLAHWIGQAYVIWMLIGVFLSRLLTFVILRDKRGTMLMLQRSAVGMTILMLTMLLMFIPFPELGITEAYRYEAFGPVEDAVSEHPERFLAWGVAYFLLMAIIEFLVGWRLPDWSDEEVEEGWKVLGN